MRVANGTYNERVNLFPRTRSARVHWIRIIGNESFPELVTLDGTDLPPVGYDTPSEGVFVSDIPVEIAGIRVANFDSAGIGAVFSSFALVRGCRLENNEVGIMAMDGGSIEVIEAVISGNQSGIRAEGHSLVSIGDFVEISDNDVGIFAWGNSNVGFDEQTTYTVANNPMSAHEHSTIGGYSSCLLIGTSCSTGDSTARCVP